MIKIEHLGIAVKDLSSANKVFEDVLGVSSYKDEWVGSEKVNTRFFKIGETKIELLVADDENNPINKFIAKRGEGIHHVAFLVDDINEEIKRLTAKGYQVLGEPRKGADNKMIIFLHPKETSGVLIELCQEI